MIPGEEEKAHLSKQDYLNRICTDLGGRAAEVVFCGEDGLTPGIAQDIKSATFYAQHMVCNWAMYEKEVGLAVISIEDLPRYTKSGEQINKILSEQMERAVSLVEEHKNVIEALVEQIMGSESKSLTKKEILEVIEKHIKK